MKLKLFLMTAATMALVSSCSSDDVIKDNAEANAIKFSAVANNASRSADYYCNTLMPDKFDVWGTVDKKSYFAAESYSKESGNTYAPEDRNYRYWPEDSIRFYAAKSYKSGENCTVDWSLATGADNWTLAIKRFAPATTADAQVDFIYAFNAGKRGTTDATTAPLPMNFRHALSQIVFKAQKKNSKIHVIINGVDICKVASEGNFALPTGTSYTYFNTNSNFNDHSIAVGEATDVNRTGAGKWTIEDTYKTAGTYSVTLESPVTLETSESAATNLTDQTAHAANTDFTKAFMIIPQNDLTAYVPTSGKASEQNGAYFLLDCQIWNISASDGTFNETNDVCLWGTKKADNSYTYKKLAVPVTPNWDWGKKYVYTFIFTDKGNGGYDPDNGNEVLVPIELNVTVDDFAKGYDETENL